MPWVSKWTPGGVMMAAILSEAQKALVQPSDFTVKARTGLWRTSFTLALFCRLFDVVSSCYTPRM
jgi:hypothetical protein